MMTTEVQIITSVALSDDDLTSVVGELCTALGVDPTPYWTSANDDVSQLWLYRLTELQTCYEDAQISNFAMMLGAPVAHYLQISMDSRPTSHATMKLLVKLMSQRWPLVLDDCYERVYAPGEIAGFLSDGCL
ncbi:hypothetical protein INH39_27360 [Massilia violaceinigra]|uniref:Uncharacterized protein n=1 Tax=Massilia violaceinigra TaxID=2045208 RepID=A0ABY4A4K4_9BURK|nr:hypothetical protein [Massilia violaceinigra]UOD29100.1 hypothetical protein INH39_27360 [Massilia violaceinigra]